MPASRKFLWSAVAFLAFVLVAFGPALTNSYQLCASNHAQRQASENNNGGAYPPYVLAVNRAGTFLDCWGTTANANGSAIGALATVLIALFTFTLWNVTGKAAKAAEDSAAALVKSEMAFCMLQGVEVTVSGEEMDKAATVRPKFKLTIQNAGRTPGFVVGVSLQFGVAPKNQDPTTIKAIGGGSYNHGFWLAPHGSQSPTNTYGDGVLKRVELDALRKASAQLFVWGDIEFRTVMPETWKSGFNYRISCVKGKSWQKNVAVGVGRFWTLKQQESDDADA